MFGIEPFDTTWIIVAVIFGVIGLFLLGYFTRDGFEGEDSFIAILIVLSSIFWPLVLSIAVIIGIVSIPILIGKHSRKINEFFKKRKQKKQKELNRIEEEFKKVKGID